MSLSTYIVLHLHNITPKYNNNALFFNTISLTFRDNKNNSIELLMMNYCSLL